MISTKTKLIAIHFGIIRMHNDLCMMCHMICKSAPEFKAAERTMLVSTSRNLAQWTYIPMLLDLIKSEHPRMWLHIKRPIHCTGISWVITSPHGAYGRHAVMSHAQALHSLSSAII